MTIMKRCYVSGEEITLAEAFEAMDLRIAAEDGPGGEEFNDFLTDFYTLIRCSGGNDVFFSEEDDAHYIKHFFYRTGEVHPGYGLPGMMICYMVVLSKATVEKAIEAYKAQ